jgi:hypothetical protein
MGNNIANSPPAEAGENLNVRQPIEIPVAPRVAARLMERFGQATDQAESSPFAGVDMDALRPVILKVASEKLDADELAVFANGFQGSDAKSIAKTLKLSAKDVAELQESATAKMRDGMLEAAFDALVEKNSAANDSEPADPFAVVRAWFSHPVKQTKGHQWIPLVVLLFLASVADEDGRLSYADAYRAVGFQPAVTEALPILKSLGFVDSDGKNIRVRRLPDGVGRAAKAAA